MIAQLLIIIFGVAGLLLTISRHGDKKKEDTYNVWYFLIYLSIYWGLLYYGGFFDEVIQAL